MSKSFTAEFLEENMWIAQHLDHEAIEKSVVQLAGIRHGGGRLFLLGVGGSAGSASHATNDFRKLAGFEAYCPSDNVSELSARTNDEGWDSVFVEWLKGSRLGAKDGILVFSVGGGSLEKNISANIVKALQYGKSVGAKILGVVGRDGGYTAQVADVCVLIPVADEKHTTPHTEAFHGVLWHLMVSHPLLQQYATKWEGLSCG